MKQILETSLTVAPRLGPTLCGGRSGALLFGGWRRSGVAVWRRLRGVLRGRSIDAAVLEHRACCSLARCWALRPAPRRGSAGLAGLSFAALHYVAAPPPPLAAPGRGINLARGANGANADRGSRFASPLEPRLARHDATAPIFRVYHPPPPHLAGEARGRHVAACCHRICVRG